MKKMKKMIGFGLALAAVSLTACGGKKEAETIRIGVVCPRTGESSLFGDVLAETVELLAKQKNESAEFLASRLKLRFMTTVMMRWRQRMQPERPY